jgi:hypothetical protein
MVQRGLNVLNYGLHRFRHLRPALIVVSAVLDFEKQVRGVSLTEPGGEYS